MAAPGRAAVLAFTGALTRVLVSFRYHGASQGNRLDMAGLLGALGLRPPRKEAGHRAPTPADAKPFTTLTADLAAARRRLVSAREAVDTALATSDAQIRKLQAFLAVHPDAQLREIAGSPEFGINALTGNHRIKLMAVLRDLADASPEGLPAALTQARRLVASFQGYIESSPRLAACDDNPLGIAVSVRQQLGPALAQLSRAVEAFAG